MEEQGPPERTRRGIVARLWALLVWPSARYGAGFLVLAGVAAGAAAWVAFERTVEATNSLAFCTSCHVMATFVHAEYQASPHYRNASGVRAICSDCHVPRAFFPKMSTKIRATMTEVPAWVTGRIETPEKYEARKPILAQQVHDRMRATDSRECRECHGWEAMSSEAQAPRAWLEHQTARRDGETCIDCHQGVAHPLPVSMVEPADEIDFGVF